MAIKRTQPEASQLYFCTSTCFNWIHLFEITFLYNEIYNWFNLLIQQGNSLCGFVLMPNHLHALIYIGANRNINTMLANGKRFLAYEIIQRLEELNQGAILVKLQNAVTTDEKLRNKKHRVFQASSDIKPCYSEQFILQKLNYIHNNPLQEQWKLAALPELYPHSSAAFYELNKQHEMVRVTHYKDI